MNRTFKFSEENAKRLIELHGSDDSIARMNCSRMDANNVIIDHTVVNPKIKRSVAGTATLEGIVNWARENEQNVLPSAHPQNQCS